MLNDMNDHFLTAQSPKYGFEPLYLCLAPVGVPISHETEPSVAVTPLSDFCVPTQDR